MYHAALGQVLGVGADVLPWDPTLSRNPGAALEVNRG